MIDYQKLPQDPDDAPNQVPPGQMNNLRPNQVPPGLLEALSRLLTKPGMIAPPQNFPVAPAMGQPPYQPTSPDDDADVDYQKMAR